MESHCNKYRVSAGVHEKIICVCLCVYVCVRVTLFCILSSCVYSVSHWSQPVRYILSATGRINTHRISVCCYKCLLCDSYSVYLHFSLFNRFLWQFFLPQIKGLMTEDVLCSDCKAHWEGLLAYINKTDMTDWWNQVPR